MRQSALGLVATAAYAPAGLASSAKVLRGGHLLAWRFGLGRQDLSGHLDHPVHAVGPFRHTHSVFLVRVPWRLRLAHQDLSSRLVRQVLPGNQVRHIRAAFLGRLARHVVGLNYLVRLRWKPDLARWGLWGQLVRQVHAVGLNALVRPPWKHGLARLCLPASALWPPPYHSPKNHLAWRLLQWPACHG